MVLSKGPLWDLYIETIKRSRGMKESFINTFHTFCGPNIAQKMKFSIKDFFSKRDAIFLYFTFYL